MSVSPNPAPAARPFRGSEGELVSVRVSVEPRLLESLLETLAGLPFPINPQIYHNATVVYVYADGRNVVQPTTLIEFPAFSGRLPQVREALRAGNFDPGAVSVKGMLEEIQSELDDEPAPPEAPYIRIIRYKAALPQ